MLDADIEKAFIELLISMGTEPKTREQMCKDLTAKQKYAFVEANKEKKKKIVQGTIRMTPAFFIGQLQSSLEVETLRELAVCLKSEPVKWVEQFLTQGTQLVLSSITNLERECNSDKGKQSVLYELLRCFFVLIRTKQGKKALLYDVKDSIKRVILCLDRESADAATRVMIFDNLCLMVTQGISSCAFLTQCHFKNFSRC